MKKLFKKGEPRPKKAGRRAGTPNKTTVVAKEMLVIAAERIGGVERLIKWIRKAPENEFVFWSSMYMRLLPSRSEQPSPTLHVHHTDVTVQIKREELARKLEERGLPPALFGVDLPELPESEPELIDVESVEENGDG
jgi:hypothetical protein